MLHPTISKRRMPYGTRIDSISSARPRLWRKPFGSLRDGDSGSARVGFRVAPARSTGRVIVPSNGCTRFPGCGFPRSDPGENSGPPPRGIQGARPRTPLFPARRGLRSRFPSEITSAATPSSFVIQTSLPRERCAWGCLAPLFRIFLSSFFGSVASCLKLRLPTHAVSSNSWSLRARPSTLHPQNRAFVHALPLSGPAFKRRPTRAPRERCTNRHARVAHGPAAFPILGGLGFRLCQSLPPLQIPPSCPGENRFSLNDFRKFAAEIADALGHPTRTSPRWSPRGSRGSGRRSSFSPPPRRVDVGLLRGAFGCWYQARSSRGLRRTVE